MTESLKTYVFTVFFSGLGAVMIWKNHSYATLPLILFYLVLLVNTFFSIGFFSKIIPPNRHEQKVIDFLLVISYLGLIANLGNETRYLLSATVLFVLATFKYVFLFGVVDARILKRKVSIDLSGSAVCALALCGSLLGYGAITNWLWAGLFLLANVYLLFIKPMYKA